MLNAKAEIDELKARLAHAQDEESFGDMSHYFESVVNLFGNKEEIFPPRPSPTLTKYCVETDRRGNGRDKAEKVKYSTHSLDRTILTPQQIHDPNHENCVSRCLYMETVLRRKKC
jgi:hypothetical protein